MKKIEVVAAVIEREDKILATQRGYGEFKGMWEFPGGKIETGESHLTALTREIKEELNSTILVGDYIKTIEYDYPQFHLTMHCYFCTTDDKIALIEHSDAKWLKINELNEVNWLPADIDVVEKIKEIKKRTKVKLK